MYEWLFWRLMKWCALVALAAATGTAVWGAGERRRQAGLVWMPVASMAVFVSGFGLLHYKGQSFSEPFALQGLTWGALSVSGAVLHVTTTRSRVGAAAALGGLMAAVGVMVFRDVNLWLGLIPGLAGALLAAQTASSDDVQTDPMALWLWFKWVGRAEGASLLFLFGVAMPFKYVLGQPELVAWTGWMHGMFFMLYIGALVVGKLRLGWSWLDVVLGTVASFLPFGTFVFERRIPAPA